MNIEEYQKLNNRYQSIIDSLLKVEELFPQVSTSIFQMYDEEEQALCHAQMSDWKELFVQDNALAKKVTTGVITSNNLMLIQQLSMKYFDFWSGANYHLALKELRYDDDELPSSRKDYPVIDLHEAVMNHLLSPFIYEFHDTVILPIITGSTKDGREDNAYNRNYPPLLSFNPKGTRQLQFNHSVVFRPKREVLTNTRELTEKNLVAYRTFADSITLFIYELFGEKELVTSHAKRINAEKQDEIVQSTQEMVKDLHQIVSVLAVTTANFLKSSRELMKSNNN